MNRQIANKNKIKQLRSRSLQALIVSALMTFSFPIFAQYNIQLVQPPGAEFAQTFGINNAGKVTGGAFDGVGNFSFIYDMKKDTYEMIDTEMAVLEISNSGVMVGDIDGVCAVRDKKGVVTTLFPPSFSVDSFCQARGVNSNGKVSGFEIDPAGVWRGFIYDSKKDTYEEFLPSPQTFAHGINAQRQVAGSIALDADEAYPGSVAGRYGYVRQPDGAVKLFEISQSLPGFTRARGISESGLVAGFYVTDLVTFDTKSYVTTVSSGSDFETITLTDDQIIFRKPCDPDLPPPPGPGYELFTGVTASQVRNDGVVVGSCTDSYFNPSTGDFVDYGNGFIATPDK